MNKKQTIVMWVGIGIFVLMGLYPPALALNRARPTWPPTCYYTFILDANDIFLEKLIVQWAIVAAITGGLMVKFREMKCPKDGTEE